MAMPDFVENTLPAITPQTALFLDFDGTLVELAARPSLVHMPNQTIAVLRALESKLGGALALVSGRSLTDLDGFLHPLRLAAAGEHGAVRRSAAGKVAGVAHSELHHALAAAQAMVRQHPTLLLEQKTRCVSLHYRQAPELEASCLAAMQAAAQRSTGLELVMGKYVVELKPLTASKGAAIGDFMQEAPFKGRHSIFAGDDLTDESGFQAVQALGGQAIKVGSGPTTAHHRCATVTQLTAWLQAAAAQPNFSSQHGVSA